MKIYLLCLLLLFSSLTFGQAVPTTYFGLDWNAPSNPYPSVTFGSMGKGSLTDWTYVEQVKNTFNWTVEDSYVSQANAHGNPILVTPIGGAPPWAVGGATDCTIPANYGLSQCQCSPNALGGQRCYGSITDTAGMNTFLNTLTTRYNGLNGHGKVAAYELMNEPESIPTPIANLVATMNAIHTAVRANDPTAEVWGPGLTFPDTYYTSGNLFDQYVAAGLTKDLDALDFHGYPHGCCSGTAAQAPEIQAAATCGGGGYVACIKAAITREGYAAGIKINQSEGSYGLNTAYPVTGNNTRPGWLARFYLLNWSVGVSRSDWYSYDSPDWGTLETSNVLNTTGTAYNQIYSWMAGSTMNQACAAVGTVWTCGLINSLGVQTLAVWNTAGSSSYTPPAGYTQYKDLAGNTTALGSTVTIGVQPILLVSTIPSASFGMHDNNQNFTGSNYPIVPFGTFRIWDKEPINWYEVETAQGVYNWTAFDTIMNKLTASGVTDILYTFGYTPPWATGGAGTSGHPNWSCLPPTNNQDMIDFISAVATRYNGRIKHYETWNEPGGGFWCGTMNQLVQVQNDVYNTVKAIDPTATVHTPVGGLSATGGDCTNSANGPYNIYAIVTATGTSNFDIVDVHLYPYPGTTYPESSPGTVYTQIANLKCSMGLLGISSRPIWNTEFGWYVPSVPVGFDLPALVARDYLYMWSQGIVRSYWYAYDNPQWGTLWDGTALTPSGVAYQQVYNWMVGSTMTTPCAANGTVWTCTLTKAGNQSLAVWNTAGTSTFVVPNGYSQYKDLAGNTTTMGSTVTIGIRPILLIGPGSSGPTSYTTNFPATENPISEGGKWTNGGTTGLDWTNIRTTPAKAMGTELATPPYSDSTATLQYRTWTNDQVAFANVFVNPPPSISCGQEIELHLRTTITPHSITGYEISYSSAFGSLVIVRWNGARGSFSVLGSFGVVVHDGDLIKATITGSTITAYVNGIQKLQVTDSTYTTGSPGIGINYTENSGCTTAVESTYGFTNFTAQDVGVPVNPLPNPPTGVAVIIH